MLFREQNSAMENAACSSGGMTTSGLVAPMPGLLFPEAAHKKQMGAPDDAEPFYVFGDSHRLPTADGMAPHAVGETNIIFLDERNVRVTSLNILVEEGAASRVRFITKSWSPATQCTDARKTGASTSTRLRR